MFGGRFRVEFPVVESTVVELDMEDVVGLIKVVANGMEVTLEILEVDKGFKLLEGSLWVDLDEGERCLGTSLEF